MRNENIIFYVGHLARHLKSLSQTPYSHIFSIF